MPVSDITMLPPTSRLRTVLTKLGDELTSIVEIVRYALRLPDDEPKDKAVYIECEPPMVIVNESIQSSQRSWMPFRAVIYGYINDGDPRVLIDFVEQVSEKLYQSTAIENYRNAFAVDDGFSIETLNVGELGFGEEFGQFKMSLEVLMHHADS